jgi:predicted phosphodiesterase
VGVGRLGLIGDVHAEDGLLAAALTFVAGQGVEAILCTGDVVDGAGDVERCCRLLVEGGVKVVRGNHDRWFLGESMRDFPGVTQAGDVSPRVPEVLSALPATRLLPTVAGPLLLCHGVGDDDMAALKPDDFGYALEANDPLQRLLRAGEVRFVVSGHTHVRMVRRLGGIVFVNPGTLRGDHEPAVAVLDLGAGEVLFHELSAEGVGAVERVRLDGADWPGGGG